MSAEKLKALKVVDLKQILQKANVPIPAKANKNDLISKIQASKEALDTYAKLYPADDLLAPPEEVDWNAEQTDPVVETSAPAPAPSSSVVHESGPSPALDLAANNTTTTGPVDDEAEKRRKRAERFGIALVEPKAPNPKPSAAKGKTIATDEQLQARAARFGIPTADKGSAANSKKRGPPAAEVDPEELERRKKRAERFAT